VDAAAVAEVVEAVAHQELMGRFRRLGTGEVWEKAPGDLVTAADVAAEARLAAELVPLVPGSAFVGEESTAAGAGLGALGGDRPVWIVDPLDGTANFVRGDERFCVMVALAERGRLVASWLCAPALGLTGSAVAGRGAVVNGRPGAVAPAGPAPLRVVVSDPAYQSDEDRARIAALAGEGVPTYSCGGVGVVYLELAQGRHDGAVFGWTTVWDHAAGLLLHKESGGWSRTGDGSGFEVGAANAVPLVLAPTAALGDRLLRAVTAR